MSDDLALARGDADPKNLAIGDAVCIRDALATYNLLPEHLTDFDLRYPRLGGNTALVEAIRAWHGADEETYVVVANGAKQALLAAMVAIREEGKGIAYHRAPYWLSYPTLAELAGLTFHDSNDVDDVEDLPRHPYFISINTSPNNPDGSVDPSPCDIWDASYALEVFGFSGPRPEHRISTWSAAKALGLPGLRVGWALTRDAGLARTMAAYVESTTSGVSTVSQEFLWWTLARQALNPENALAAMNQARQVMVANGALFQERLGRFCTEVRGLPDCGRGVFAWFRVDNDKRFRTALKTTGITVVEGRKFGAREPGWYRMNLGLATEDLDPVLADLEAALV